MITTIKSTIAACGFLVVVSAPLTVEADTSVFSGKGAYGLILGTKGALRFRVTSFETVSKSKSDKANSSGASILGQYDNPVSNECWYAFGYTDTIQFKATGSLPKELTASGSVSLEWIEYCAGLPAFEDTVTFNMDLRAMKDRADSRWGTEHYEYQQDNVKTNIHYKESFAPAALNGSSISSQAFGTVTLSRGEIGQSTDHTVQMEIIR